MTTNWSQTFLNGVSQNLFNAAVAQPGTAPVSKFAELTGFRKDIPVQIWAAA